MAHSLKHDMMQGAWSVMFLFRYFAERRSSMQIGNTTITPLTKQEQLTLSCDSDNLSERDEAEAEVNHVYLTY